MIRDQISADDRIADVLWFLKGMAAAARDDDTAAELKGLAQSLAEVRRWLIDLADGDLRLLGHHDGDLRIVLAEHEFEKLVDAIKVPEGKERDLALELIPEIYKQFDFERKRFAARNNPEVPF